MPENLIGAMGPFKWYGNLLPTWVGLFFTDQRIIVAKIVGTFQAAAQMDQAIISSAKPADAIPVLGLIAQIAPGGLIDQAAVKLFNSLTANLNAASQLPPDQLLSHDKMNFTIQYSDVTVLAVYRMNVFTALSMPTVQIKTTSTKVAYGFATEIMPTPLTEDQMQQLYQTWVTIAKKVLPDKFQDTVPAR